MLGLGTTELVIILILVLVVFGAGKLPQVGRSLGSAISEFKDSVKGSADDEDDAPAKSDADGDDKAK